MSIQYEMHDFLFGGNFEGSSIKILHEYLSFLLMKNVLRHGREKKIFMNITQKPREKNRIERPCLAELQVLPRMRDAICNTVNSCSDMVMNRLMFLVNFAVARKKKKQHLCLLRNRERYIANFGPTDP